jgi:hypothetical protein
MADGMDVRGIDRVKELKRRLAPIAQHRESIQAFAEAKARLAGQAEAAPPAPVVPPVDPWARGFEDQPFEAESLLLDEELAGEWGDFAWLDSPQDRRAVGLLEPSVFH